MSIKKDIRKAILYSLMIFLVGGIFLFGFYLGKTEEKKDIESLVYSQEAKNSSLGDNKDYFDFNLYFEVWNSIKSSHVDKNKIKDKDLFYGSLEGLAEGTNDPYTIFMDPESTEDFYQDLSGTFEGIGAEIGMRNDTITVIAPLDGMPAQKAGLRSGDKIYAIDGESALGLSVNEAVKRIRGEKGTEVTLTIIRGEDKPIDITIVRDKIFVPSIEHEMRDDGIYYIKISSFNEDTESLFYEAVANALIEKPEGIILDLRNNPGGYLETSITVASEWIESGPIVAEQFGENRRMEHPSNGNARLADIPTVVLINQGSASASEIVAGALRDYNKATIVGKQSFGKGSVQSLRNLSDGSSLKLTVAKWLTPEGDYIDEKGIEPQVEVDLTEEDINKELDPQLDKAVEILLDNGEEETTE